MYLMLEHCYVKAVVFRSCASSGISCRLSIPEILVLSLIMQQQMMLPW